MNLLRVLCLALFIPVLSPWVIGQDELKEAQALLEAEKFQEAATKFEAVLDKDAKSLAARVGCARAYIGLEDYETANFHAVKAESLDKTSAVAAELAGTTFRLIGEVKRANRIDPTSDFEYAIESFKRAAELEPKNVLHVYNVAWISEQNRSWQQAGEWWLKAAEMDPAHADYPLFATNAMSRAGLADKAVEALDRLIAGAANPTMLMIAKGQALLSQKKPDDAAAVLVSALTHKAMDRSRILDGARAIWNCFGDPVDHAKLEHYYSEWTKGAEKEPEAWWFLGFVQQSAGRFEPAIASFTRQNELLGGAWPEALLRLGQCLGASGKIDEAAKSIEAATKKEWNWQPPHDPVTALKQLVDACYNRQDFGGCIRISEKFLLPMTAIGEQYKILQNLGFFYREWGSAADNDDERQVAKERYTKSRDFYEKAVAVLDKAVGATPAYKAQVINDCGLMYHYHFNDLQTALKHYKAALAHDATCADAILNYGRLLIKQQKFAEAVEMLERGPKDRPDIQFELRNARNRLEKKN